MCRQDRQGGRGVAAPEADQCRAATLLTGGREHHPVQNTADPLRLESLSGVDHRLKRRRLVGGGARDVLVEPAAGSLAVLSAGFGDKDRDAGVPGLVDLCNGGPKERRRIRLDLRHARRRKAAPHVVGVDVKADEIADRRRQSGEGWAVEVALAAGRPSRHPPMVTGIPPE